MWRYHKIKTMIKNENRSKWLELQGAD
jgi:hypothetical protein